MYIVLAEYIWVLFKFIQLPAPHFITEQNLTLSKNDIFHIYDTLIHTYIYIYVQINTQLHLNNASLPTQFAMTFNKN